LKLTYQVFLFIRVVFSMLCLERLAQMYTKFCLLKTMFAVLRLTVLSIRFLYLPFNNGFFCQLRQWYNPYLETSHGRNQNLYAMYANMPVYILA